MSSAMSAEGAALAVAARDDSFMIAIGDRAVTMTYEDFQDWLRDVGQLFMEARSHRFTNLTGPLIA